MAAEVCNKIGMTAVLTFRKLPLIYMVGTLVEIVASSLATGEFMDSIVGLKRGTGQDHLVSHFNSLHGQFLPILLPRK